MLSLFRILLISLTMSTASMAKETLVPLPSQPEGVAWPTEAWPIAPPSPRLESVLNTVMSGVAPGAPTNPRALLIIKGGKIIGERYAPGFNATSKFQSWSMSKSIIHALIGILIRDGQIDLYAPAKVPRWNRKVRDPRKAITVENLLRMESGLMFSEDYSNPWSSDVLQMLFGNGRLDTAEYAAGHPLEAKPGTFWHYSSGPTNILSGIVRNTIAAQSAGDYRTFINDSLFNRLGIHSAVPEFDAANNFIGSSFLHMTARDWARFGYLYLRGGIWDHTKILPENWANHARTPTPNSHGQYGAHFWLNAVNPETGKATISDRIPTDAFMARGIGGQFMLLVPSQDLTIVYLGVTYGEEAAAINAIANIIDATQ